MTGFCFTCLQCGLVRLQFDWLKRQTLSQSNRCWWAKTRGVSRLFISEFFFKKNSPLAPLQSQLNSNEVNFF